jgi:hypothetical protein
MIMKFVKNNVVYDATMAAGSFSDTVSVKGTVDGKVVNDLKMTILEFSTLTLEWQKAGFTKS